MTSATKIADHEAALVASVIEQMENNPTRWTKPWVDGFSSGLPFNAKTGKRYNGGNAWFLAICGSLDERCETPAWATYRQWADLGGQIQKGETGCMILVPRQWSKTEMEDGAEVTRSGLYFTIASVFNYCQQDGAVLADPPQVDDPIDVAEEFYTAVGASVSAGHDRACYVPTLDEIQMPTFEAFRSAVHYYATLGHEHVHWTGAEKRLHRISSVKFGSDEYAFEELVAELGAVLLGSHLGYATEPREDHAAYLANWKRQLASDPKVMWRAATAASKAAGFLVDRAEANAPEPVEIAA